MLALCPGKHQHQLSPLAGEAWAMEDPGQGGPLPPPPPCGVVQGGGAGVPPLGSSKGFNTGLAQPLLALGLKC